MSIGPPTTRRCPAANEAPLRLAGRLVPKGAVLGVRPLA